jgi:hypothetical protein
MAKKIMEDVVIDDTATVDMIQEPIVKTVKEETYEKKYSKKEYNNDDTTVSCLRNERVIVRYVPRSNSLITNPKHILYGGMAEGAKKTYVVPRLSSGTFVNVLTKAEKAFLEEYMGLEYNALSVFNKNNNFWDDSNEEGISSVTLLKQDNILNLSDPEDYIRYKILLANKDYIAPSLQELQDRPKPTYQFVIISTGDETKMAKKNMSATMQCYKEFGKIEDNIDILRLIIETIDGRPIASNTKLDFLQTRANDLIQADSKLFLKVISDPMLSTKVLIRKSIDKGYIIRRGNYHYIKDGNLPLCEVNEEPTLNMAAKFLNLPKNQEIKFSLEAKVNS